MYIQVALANVGGQVSNDELLKYLVNQLPNTAFYKRQPPQGAVTMAAFALERFFT